MSDERFTALDIKSRNAVRQMKDVFDRQDLGPTGVFSNEQAARLDKVVQRITRDWCHLIREEINVFMIFKIIRVEFQYRNRKCKELVIGWALCSVIRWLTHYGMLATLIIQDPDTGEWWKIEKYLASMRILSTLVSFATGVRYLKRDPDGQGRTMSELTQDEMNKVIKDYAAFMQLTVMPEDMEKLIHHSLSPEQQERFRAAMTS